MTRFSIRQLFHCSAEQFWKKVHFAPELNRRFHLEALGTESFDVLKFEETSTEIVYLARVTPQMYIPRPIRRVVSSLAYVEEQRLDRLRGLVTFSVRLEMGGIETSGTALIEAVSNQACIRITNIELKADIPILGTLVERFAEKAARDSYQKQLGFVNDWLCNVDRGGSGISRGVVGVG